MEFLEQCSFVRPKVTILLILGQPDQTVKCSVSKIVQKGPPVLKGPKVHHWQCLKNHVVLEREFGSLKMQGTVSDHREIYLCPHMYFLLDQ